MRSYEEYEQILELWGQGKKKKRIAILTGISRSTVRDCINRYYSTWGLREARVLKPDALYILETLRTGTSSGAETLFEAYAYLLGLYLGDGCISRLPRTYKLRITLDMQYPNIINECDRAIQVLFPFNKVNILQGDGNYVEVGCLSNHWPAFFPQHGTGPKHLRPIILEPWQQAIVDTCPIPFLRGLIHSDGCRSTNIVKGKNYPRYEFSNMSSDIRGMFCSICDQLGIHWRTASGGRNIQIARRKDVDYLDRFIGPKS